MSALSKRRSQPEHNCRHLLKASIGRDLIGQRSRQMEDKFRSRFLCSTKHLAFGRMPDMQRLLVALNARFLAGFILLLSVQISRAGSATWNSSPATNDWNTNGNWTPNTGYPNGSTDTATFALSSTTGVSISANTDVGSITFTSAATNPYTITVSPTFILTVHAPGIANNSGITQNFVTPNDGAGGVGAIFFILGASAGNMMTFTNSGTSFL